MNKYILSLLTSLLIGVTSLTAQNENRLMVADVSALPGAHVQVPVLVENSSEVVAVQFTLSVPDGSSISYLSSPRISDHTVSLRPQTSGDYLCLVLSPSNAAITNSTDTLLVLDMAVSDDYEEGSVHAFALTDVVLTAHDGSNCLTEAVAGQLTVLRRPDFQVLNVQTDQEGYYPQYQLTASWQVQNIGQGMTGAGWQEGLYLVQDGEPAVTFFIGNTHFDELLQPNEMVSRNMTVTLPAVLGMDGNCRVEVRLTPFEGSGESDAAHDNNLASSEVIAIGKRAYLDIKAASVFENYANPIQCTLTRSGTNSAALEFILIHTGDNRVTMPEMVTIPAGQSGVNFYIQLTDNDDFEDDKQFVVNAYGDGYEAVSDSILIQDNDRADLSITASKTTLQEGETFSLTISTNYVFQEPLVVALTSENGTRFHFPTEVTIPAGETGVTVDVTTVNDELPAMSLSNAFRVSAPRHNPAEVIVILEDDDMPELHLTLTPSRVSEGDGITAVSAELRRTGKTNNRIVVRISDDAHGGLYLNQTELAMESGEEVVHFNLGPVDNANVDGPRTYTVTAAVYLSDCSCNVSAGTLGSVLAQLEVMDDDGPTLGLQPSASNVNEGKSVQLTIRRNTSTTEAMTVQLNSDSDDRFEAYDHEVTIPAGQASVIISLTSKSNDVPGDSHTVTFTTTADGFNSGTCYLMLTDQTLPDATVSLQMSADEVEIGSQVTATITVANTGIYGMPAGVDVFFYSYNQRIALQTTRALAVGESEELPYDVTMPETIGTARFYATVNETATLHELNTSNNSSATIRVRTKAPYTVALTLEKEVLQQGDSVLITGQLTGTRIANQPVQVYVINEGARLTKQVESDGEGYFSLMWKPYATQSGHFIVGACYPGENLTTELTSFNIYGIQRTNNSPIKCETLVGDTFTGSISLSNPGSLGLTGLKVEKVSVPENCTADFELQDAMTAGSTAVMHYTLLGSAPSPDPQRYESIDLRITSTEGARLEFSMGYYCRAQQASLVVTPQQLNTTMIKGQSRDYPVTITNVGKGESGPISLSLPSWMSSATGETIASLAQNDTATVILRLTPTEDMQLNVHKTGQLGINLTDPKKGNGTYINYDVTPVSEVKGTLVVDVTDENTYYTAEKPHLAGASVEVRNPVSDALIASGTTDTTGLFSVEIPEGYYRIKVNADGHDSYNNIIMVDPGTETVKTVCLSIQAITIDWKVEETEVEDEYEIVTTVKYETHVPVPVIELSIPDKISADLLAVGESLIFNATLTNTGLIAGLDVRLMLPEPFGGLTFEAMGEYAGLKITPQQTIVIPVRVTRTERVTEANCFTTIGLLYHWDCGNELKSNYYTRSLQVGSCSRSTGSFNSSGVSIGSYGGYGGGYGSPNGFIGNNYSSTEYAPQVTEVTDCHDVQVGDNGEIIHTVCATISLQFKQTLVLTRQAFRGTLTIFNGNDSIPMRDVKVNLEVKDEDGIVATSHEFEMHGETITGFEGNVDITSGWTLAAKETGVATIMFIPSKYAAPEVLKLYSFGGTVTYIDPFSGLEVTRELSPVTMTVKPTADLDLTYFMQRDVFADDPLTSEVEPSQLVEFSLLINNVGSGEAKNVRMVTNQPEIVDNQKNLAIQFEIISSQLNGGEANLALGQSIPTDFGTLAPHTTAYAQWWFQSTLLGHFTEYDVTATHVTSYDNPDLSLLNEVTIHELIRSIKVPGSTLAGFAANDIQDDMDAPDKLYLSDGATADIAIAADAEIERVNDSDYRLTVTSGQAGWNYGRITDPTNGRARLLAIVREGTNESIDLRNFWQTDRTMHDGRVWDYEYNLHFIDEMVAEGETYLLTFEARPEVELEVASFEGVPEDGTPVYEPLQKVWVNFNKPIDPATFTIDDMTLSCQGALVETPITITPLSDTRFEIELHEATTTEVGYYVLTVQTADITDTEGYTGSTGKQAAWTQTIKPTQFVAVTATGYGEVVAGITVISNSTETFEVMNGSNLKLALKPEVGFEDIYIEVNGVDASAWNVEDDTLVVREITDSVDIIVTFELSDFSLLGDVNRDGKVSVGDVVKTANHILGRTPKAPFNVRLADANNDGAVDAADLVEEVAFITGTAVSGVSHEVKGEKLGSLRDGEAPPVNSHRCSAALISHPSTLNPQPSSLTSHLSPLISNDELILSLDHPEEFTSFQMTLTLPEGMEVSDIQLGEGVAAGHVLAYNHLEDGRVKVLAYSMNNAPFQAAASASPTSSLLTLQLPESSSHLSSLTSQLTIDEILFVTPNRESHRFDPTTDVVEIESSPGMARPGSNAKSVSETYDMSGRRVRMNQLTQGVYVVRQGNRTQKITVK